MSLRVDIIWLWKGFEYFRRSWSLVSLDYTGTASANERLSTSGILEQLRLPASVA